MNHYRDCLRTTLERWAGYECQATEGDFMFAFASSQNAAMFCLKVSHALLLMSVDEHALPALQLLACCNTADHGCDVGVWGLSTSSDRLFIAAVGLWPWLLQGDDMLSCRHRRRYWMWSGGWMSKPCQAVLLGLVTW